MTDQPSNPFLLYEIAHDLLDAAGEALDASSSGTDAPQRRFVSMAAPVADCTGGQLTVHLQPLKPGVVRTAPNVRGCHIVTVGSFLITLLRCAVGPSAQGKVPSAESLDGEAYALYEDAWRMWAALTARWKDGTLLPSYACDCDQITFGQMTPINRGGVCGWSWPVEIQVNDVKVAV